MIDTIGTKLPENFTGVFQFTNWTDEDFTDKWNSVEYTFPAKKSSPMIIAGESPEGVQNIRKQFAKNLAIREFYKTDKFKSMNNIGKGERPSLYLENDLTEFAQKCLIDLPIEMATATAIPKDSSRNYKASKVVEAKTDLKAEFRDEMPALA